jgi:IMP dehydrogenase
MDRLFVLGDQKMERIAADAVTFDDVLLVPSFSEVLPSDVSLRSKLTRNIDLNIPMVAAAMDTVTESRLAIALAQEGGIGIVHKNMSLESQAKEVRAVKKFESGIIRDPITISSAASLNDLINLTSENNISGVPVVDGDDLVGIITSRDIRFETRRDIQVKDVMTPKERLVTATEGADFSIIQSLLHEHRIEKVLIVDEKFKLTGMITVKDIAKAEAFPMACKDALGQLRVGASVGVGGDSDDRVAALVEAGVDIVVVDTAHGHTKAVLDRVSWIKQKYPELDVMGGNVATSDGARALIDSGVDSVKVGIGPGSICTTRIVAGIGVPQITAITDAVEAALESEVPVVADGGIRYSGDIAKAIAAGANVVMIGSLLAGAEESPGEVELFQGRTYKSYRGMGSMGAMAQSHGSSDRYFQEVGSDAGKLVPEGVEGRVAYKGPVSSIVHQLMGGLRASMGYTGCSNIGAMRTETKFVRVSAASMAESHVHDVSITKEAPNYPTKF